MKSLFKTSFVSTVAMFALTAGLSAKVIGSGNVTTATRPATGFHSVDLRSSGSVIITQGDTDGLVIEAEDNVLPVIETSVTADGTLCLEFKANEEIHVTKPVIFKVTAKALDTVVITGLGSITAKALKADRFTVQVNGSGDVNLAGVEVDALTVALHGSGNVKLAGKAKAQTVDIHGSGDYEAAALKTAAATVTVAGSGDCEISASETLAVNVSGSGDVGYYGSPTVTKHVSGSGSVDALGAGK